MANYDPEYTSNWYDQLAADEYGRWDTSLHMLVAHAIYLHHLRSWAKPGQRVLEVGCGAGRFTREIVSLGARVTAFDISPVQIKLCKENAPGAENYVVGTVVDLSSFDTDSFDSVVAIGGVLSYCFEQVPNAIAEMARVTKPGGVLGLSVMGLFGTLHRFLPEIMKIPTSANRVVVSSGDLPRDLVGHNGHECHMFRAQEIRDRLLEAGLENIQTFAQGWLTMLNDEQLSIDAGSSEWKFLVETEIEASQLCPDAGKHIIAQARKPIA